MKEDFNAKNMRELTYNAQHYLENEEFQNAKDKIIAAANQGYYSLNLTLNYPITIKALQVLGFRVRPATEISIATYASGKAPNYYEVCWNGHK